MFQFVNPFHGTNKYCRGSWNFDLSVFLIFFFVTLWFLFSTRIMMFSWGVVVVRNSIGTWKSRTDRETELNHIPEGLADAKYWKLALAQWIVFLCWVECFVYFPFLFVVFVLPGLYKILFFAWNVAVLITINMLFWVTFIFVVWLQ